MLYFISNYLNNSKILLQAIGNTRRNSIRQKSSGKFQPIDSSSLPLPGPTQTEYWLESSSRSSWLLMRPETK